MARLLGRRIAVSLLILWLVGTATFVVFFLLPSTDPAILRAGRGASDPAVLAVIREDLGLDRPLFEQYARFLRDLVQLDLGRSYATGDREPVLGLVLDRVPVTVALTAGATALWLAIAIPAGALAAARPGSRRARLVSAVSVVSLCAPVYWVGLVALLLLSEELGLVPLLPGAGSYRPFLEDPVAWAGSFVLPCLVLAFGFAAVYARLIEASLADVLEEDFVRTARAKGVPERRLLWRHGVRAAITPVVTLLGLDVGALLGGAVLVETVFNLPGLGTLAFDAVGRGDLPVIQGTVLFGAVAVIAANLLVDVAYAVLDPRVRVH